MEKWRRYELGLFWFCVCNFITVTYLSVKEGMAMVHIESLAMQYGLLIIFMCILFRAKRLSENREVDVLEPTCSNPLDLRTHEKLHEQKRHYQVAAALIELGEREQAVAYIETVLEEIA